MKFENGMNLSCDDVAKAIYDSPVDYIPVLVEPDSINEFKVVDRIGLTALLREKHWEFDFFSMWGWGYDTPALRVKATDGFLYKDVEIIDVFLPKDVFGKLGHDDFHKKNIEFEKLDEATISFHSEWSFGIFED